MSVPTVLRAIVSVAQSYLLTDIISPNPTPSADAIDTAISVTPLFSYTSASFLYIPFSAARNTLPA